jgi:hypothetical protein
MPEAPEDDIECFPFNQIDIFLNSPLICFSVNASLLLTLILEKLMVEDPMLACNFSVVCRMYPGRFPGFQNKYIESGLTQLPGGEKA